MRQFIEHLTEGRKLPAGYDTFGFKIVRPDLGHIMATAGHGLVMRLLTMTQ